jgi:hypothetical protein
MARKGACEGWNNEQLYVDEGPQERLDPEYGVNASPYRLACWLAKDYEGVGRFVQENH